MSLHLEEQYTRTGLGGAATNEDQCLNLRMLALGIVFARIKNGKICRAPFQNCKGDSEPAERENRADETE